MKFICNRATLASVMGNINSVVPSRSLRPVLQNVHLSGNADNTITISGTDLEIGMSMLLPVENLTEPQTVLVNSALLTGIVSEDTSEKVEFTVTPEGANVKTNRGEFAFAICNEEFPEIKKIEDDNFVTINGRDLQEAVERTKFAVSHSDGKYTFNGICVNFEGEKIDFASSDGNRLSLVSKQISNPKKISNLALVICKGMTELARLCGADKTADIQFAGNEMIARVGDARLVSRLLEGKFPQYRGVIPAETPLKVTLDKQELLNGLRLVGKMCTDEVRSVSLEGANGKMVLSLNSGASGSGRYELDAVIEGGEVSTAFNCGYLIDAINALKNKEVTLSFVQNGKPAIIVEGDFIHVVTPVTKG